MVRTLVWVVDKGQCDNEWVALVVVRTLVQMEKG